VKFAVPIVLSERFLAIVFENVNRRTGRPESGQVTIRNGLSLAASDESTTNNKRVEAAILDIILSFVDVEQDLFINSSTAKTAGIHRPCPKPDFGMRDIPRA
jgi:hypothetical protein